MEKAEIIQEIRNSIKELNSFCPNPPAAILYLETAIKELKALYNLPDAG